MTKEEFLKLPLLDKLNKDEKQRVREVILEGISSVTNAKTDKISELMYLNTEFLIRILRYILGKDVIKELI